MWKRKGKSRKRNPYCTRIHLIVYVTVLVCWCYLRYLFVYWFLTCVKLMRRLFCASKQHIPVHYVTSASHTIHLHRPAILFYASQWFLTILVPLRLVVLLSRSRSLHLSRFASFHLSSLPPTDPVSYSLHLSPFFLYIYLSTSLSSLLLSISPFSALSIC